ncbi:hepatocyte cell adhesion molecule isoform X2 [Huso huso]|uniref:Hepatocyte cell adhesion molecule isoform X2 n=1 Tax=Huso huso TaxID=61971 RepID=A0ABR0ZGP4_HUSHU
MNRLSLNTVNRPHFKNECCTVLLCIMNRIFKNTEAHVWKRNFALNTLMIYQVLVLHLFGQCEGGTILTVAGSITNASVGDRVMFPVTAEGNMTYELSLLFQSDTKILSWISNNPSNPTIFHLMFVDRIQVDGTGSVFLDNVQLSDSGQYDMQINYVRQTMKTMTRSFQLHVFEPVSKPNVTAVCSVNNITMTCSTSQGTHVSYRWEKVPACSSESCVSAGAEKLVDGLYGSTDEYKCIAENPVSTETSDPLGTQACDENLQEGPRHWWVVITCVIFLGILLTGFSVYLYKKTKNNNKENTDLQLQTEERPDVLIEPVYVTEERSYCRIEPVYVTEESLMPVLHISCSHYALPYVKSFI